jgi:hypothetical protein
MVKAHEFFDLVRQRRLFLQGAAGVCATDDAFDRYQCKKRLWLVPFLLCPNHMMQVRISLMLGPFTPTVVTPTVTPDGKILYAAITIRGGMELA